MSRSANPDLVEATPVTIRKRTIIVIEIATVLSLMKDTLCGKLISSVDLTVLPSFLAFDDVNLPT